MPCALIEILVIATSWISDRADWLRWNGRILMFLDDCFLCQFFFLRKWFLLLILFFRFFSASFRSKKQAYSRTKSCLFFMSSLLSPLSLFLFGFKWINLYKNDLNSYWQQEFHYIKLYFDKDLYWWINRISKI
jgi:hypothetical protein